jgi:hypothetical protein
MKDYETPTIETYGSVEKLSEKGHIDGGYGDSNHDNND